MRYPLRYVSLAVVVAAALALSGCGTKAEEQKPAAAPTTTQPAAPANATPASTTPASAANAESLVKANCIACHGDTLDGKGAEKKNLTKVGARLNKDQIAAKITNGGGGMTAFKDKLKDNEISAIAEWLAAKK
jgi:cytochrome c551